MASSSSWHEETDGKINYTKLCRLLVDGGTKAVRSVFDGIHPPSSLKANLNANKTTLQNLKKPAKGKVLNNEQWDKLYPPSGSDPNSEDFDITLLFVLLRNICKLRPPLTCSGKPKRSWDKLPHTTDKSLEANLVRIKYFRNNTIAHKPNTDLNDVDFEQHWQDISSALKSLGLSQDGIKDLKKAPLGRKDYNQLLYDWHISDKDINEQLDNIESDTADIKSDTADLKSDTADLKSDTADLKSDTADLKSDTADIKTDTADMKEKLDDIRNVCVEAQRRAIQKMHFSDFRSEINRKCKCFHPNTRQWILDQVKSHVDSDQPDSCVMLIKAGPGMGKSTVAAKICQTYTDLGRFAACHFFQFSNSTRNNPRLMLQSIAKQMCDTVPGYGQALESKLQTNLGKDIGDMNCEELLTIFLEEPLCNVEQTDGNLVVVLDALDECSHDSRDELLKALRTKLSCLPSWLRFIVTSRPSTNASALGSIVEIREEDNSNIKDLEVFFSCELKVLYPQYHIENGNLVQNLVKMTKGLFLVAFFVIDLLKRENIESPKNVLERFPNGISSVYENYFSRLKEVLLPYIAEEERFYKMLEAVVATNNPLPKKMFYNILRLKSEHEVPRQERNRRKDALNSLHCLFPVEGDHVTAFHKSVFDWLTLQEDEKHDFSVRIEDGDEVLASQCNEVLSDLRDRKKDLAKPLNLSDSEKYALKFLCHLVEKRSSVVNPDKYGFFSNIYILTAISIVYINYSIEIEQLPFDDCKSDVIISSSLLDHVHRIMTIFFPMRSLHDPCCRFFRDTLFVDTLFGSYLAFVLQAVYGKGLCEETTPNALIALQTHRFPYFDEYNLLQCRLSERLSFTSLRDLLNCKEVFLAVLPVSRSNSLSTAVHMFQLDGRLIREKFFPGKRLIATSPNINFIVTAEENGNKIEILDATTLEVVSQYQFSHDAIKTCHVFGDDQGSFIVIKGCHDNKVYVIEGLTGQVRNIITVNEGSDVMDVSCLGHIVVSRTWERDEPEEINTFTNKDDGEVELMNLMVRPSCFEFSSSPKAGLQTPPYLIYTYRELFLYHYDRGEEPIPIHPTVKRECQCLYRKLPSVNLEEAIHVSEDGRLLAYHYQDSIFIVNTSDGSLFKRCSLQSLVIDGLGILFVSQSYLVMVDQFYMSVINVKTDEIEHNIYLPHPFLTRGYTKRRNELSNAKQYLVLPEEDGKSFNLINSHFEPGNYEVSRLVFHNLNLQGLQ